MSKRKPARTIKVRSASKIRSKAAGSGQPTGRANSKQAWVLALLCGPSGATIATVTRSTGWQPHTVRAFMPAVLRKDLLGRMIAYRLQERAFGGLDRESLRFLHGLARHGGSPRRRLKPGTVLVRDYQGQRHTVTVVSDGFDWQGATYPSLSAIARAITGTAWSGPRFFALARANGAPARRNQNASAREGRDGSQPARGMNASEMNTASLPLQTASHA